MLPEVVARKLSWVVSAPAVKAPPLIVNAGAVPEESGTARSRYQGEVESPLPFFSIPIDVPPTAIVSLPEPVPVVHAETVAGGGQKPTGSTVCPKAESDKLKSKIAMSIKQRFIESPWVFESARFTASGSPKCQAFLLCRIQIHSCARPWKLSH